MNYSKEFEALVEAYEYSGGDADLLQSDQVASLVVNGNQVLAANEIPGVHMRSEQIENGVRVWLTVDPDTVLEYPIHLCFGVLPEEGVQEIISEYDIGENAQVAFLSHCSFPNAVKVVHNMEAQVRVGAGASMNYTEVHYHGPQGGVTTRPRTHATVGPGGRYINNFKMVEGKVGDLDIDFVAELDERAVGEYTTKAYGKGDDQVKIREVLYLKGAEARGLTKTNVVVTGEAYSDVYTEMHGLAPHTRGHMDCTEVVSDRAVAKNVPVVYVNHYTSKVTHEAAIGSVDRKQVETLMSRGLDEDEAVEIVVQGLLR
jgi:hypothetical protein